MNHKPRAHNLVGLRFGRLVVLRRGESRPHRHARWLCKCDCGMDVTVSSHHLKDGRTLSCGCWRRERSLRDIAGRRFGHLLVIHRAGRASDRRAMWLCTCDCGARIIVSGNNLRSGNSQSCGCWANRKHGHSPADHPTRTYRSWVSMRERCTNPRTTSFHRYGGRGITVCERWMDFRNFLADMGERPPGKTIDRWPNNDGNYEPGNCRWATPKEQMSNRTKTVNTKRRRRQNGTWI